MSFFICFISLSLLLLTHFFLSLDICGAERREELILPKARTRSFSTRWETKQIATSSSISSLKLKDQTPDFSSTEQSPKLGESFLPLYKVMVVGIAGLGSPIFGEGEKRVEPLMLLLSSFLLKNCLNILLGRTCTHHQYSWEVREDLK